MDPNESDTTKYRSVLCELTTHQLRSPQKKSRSNSINGGVDNAEKDSKDETLTKPSTVHELRKHFDKKSDGPPPPPPRTAKTRRSGQIISTQFRDNLAATLEPATYRGKSLPQIKPLNDDNSSGGDTPRMTIKIKPDISIDEPENSPSLSPLPVAVEKLCENESERRTSVQSLRELFTKQIRFSPPTAATPVPLPLHHSTSVRLSTAVSIPMIRPVLPPSSPIPTQSSSPPENFIKSQLCDTISLPSLDKLEQASGGDSSISSNMTLSASTSSDISFTEDDNDVNSAKRTKLRRCFEEVYTTEKTYTKVLYVLSYKLAEEVKTVCEKDDTVLTLFNDNYKQLVGNFKQIYHLHHDLILPELEKYITEQLTGNMWTVLEQHFKPIEVLYKNYYIIYSTTQGKIDELCKSHPLIHEAMLKCQVHLGNIYPTAQFNCSNQRLLRYILLMDTCLKYLDKDSSEYESIRSIHDELDRIAIRCEEELTISPFQLYELRDRLDNKFECIKGDRHLLWHGPVKKQSPRRHLDVTQRYLILWSDCILVCNEESSRKLEIKRELAVGGITIEYESGSRKSITQSADSTSTGIAYFPFRVNAVEKSYEFLAEKESERQLWVKKIRQASDVYKKRNSSIEIRQSNGNRDEQQLGVRAPAWINDNDVTRCQHCNNRFKNSIISSRRHHCRSCGRCICNTCSTRKIMLEYCKGENEVRVCDACYTHFTGINCTKNAATMIKSTRDVERTLIYGDFRMANSNEIVWISLQEDFQLHVFGGKLDQAENWTIKLSDLVEMQLDPDTRTFTLRETTKTHAFVLELNHQIFYEKNDLLEEKLKNAESKPSFHVNLWFEAMQLAGSTTLPDWYIRKRDSADSGVSNIG